MSKDHYDTDSDADSSSSSNNKKTLIKQTNISGTKAELHWVEKYRPANWKNIIGNRQTISTIRKLVEGGTDGPSLAIPHMLFYGPPGSGKTTSIIVASKAMYGDAWDHMVLELNASNDRGIDAVRQKIIGFVGTANYLYKACGIAEPKHSYKLVILDEVELMTNDAQATLRRLMEETSTNARFCLICNSQNRIDLAIQSRCVPFRFQPVDSKSTINRLIEIAKAESVIIDHAAINILCELSNGDMRKCINVLQVMSLSGKKIGELDIYKYFGILDRVQIDKLIKSINIGKGGQSNTYKQLCDIVMSDGLDLKNIITGIYRYIRNIKIADKYRCKFLIDLALLETYLGSLECDRIHIGTVVGILADLQQSMQIKKVSNKKKLIESEKDSSDDSN